MQGIPSDWGVIFLSIQSIFEVRPLSATKHLQIFSALHGDVGKDVVVSLTNGLRIPGKASLDLNVSKLHCGQQQADALVPPTQEASREDQMEKPTVKISHYEVQIHIICWAASWSPLFTSPGLRPVHDRI